MQRFFAHIMFCLLALQANSQRLSVGNLRCESTIDPLGVERSDPRLSWELKSNQRNVMQTAYHILVADDSILLNRRIGNIWDSKDQ